VLWCRAQIAPDWAREYGGKTLDINGTATYHYEFKVNKTDPVPLAIAKLKGQVYVGALLQHPGFRVAFDRLSKGGMNQLWVVWKVHMCNYLLARIASWSLV